MLNQSAQKILFNRIKELLPAGASLADAISEVLHVSGDSAYRRIRGETPLVLDEAFELCKAYRISLDELLYAQPNTVTFQAVQLNGHYSFDDYLTDICKHLQQLSLFTEKKIIYLAKDIPIFYYFLFQPLFAFRYFFWMKSILQHPAFAHRTFSFDVLPAAIEAKGKEILKLYSTVPSIEIWNNESINSIISQIEYYRESGYFKSDKDVERLYESVQHTLEHLRRQAEAGCKLMPGQSPELKKENFQLFHNRLILGDNTILVLQNGNKTLYLNHDVLNYMITQNEKFCEEVYQKMQNMMRRATLLSQVSEKQRQMFFNALLRKIPKRQSATVNTTKP